MNDSVTGRRMEGEGPFTTSFASLFEVSHERYFGSRSVPVMDPHKFKAPLCGELELFQRVAIRTPLHVGCLVVLEWNGTGSV